MSFLHLLCNLFEPVGTTRLSSSTTLSFFSDRAWYPQLPIFSDLHPLRPTVTTPTDDSDDDLFSSSQWYLCFPLTRRAKPCKPTPATTRIRHATKDAWARLLLMAYWKTFGSRCFTNSCSSWRRWGNLSQRGVKDGTITRFPPMSRVVIRRHPSIGDSTKPH